MRALAVAPVSAAWAGSSRASSASRDQEVGDRRSRPATYARDERRGVAVERVVPVDGDDEVQPRTQLVDRDDAPVVGVERRMLGDGPARRRRTPARAQPRCRGDAAMSPMQVERVARSARLRSCSATSNVARRRRRTAEAPQATGASCRRWCRLGGDGRALPPAAHDRDDDIPQTSQRTSLHGLPSGHASQGPDGRRRRMCVRGWDGAELVARSRSSTVATARGRARQRCACCARPAPATPPAVPRRTHRSAPTTRRAW